ncbi:hypothetical protein [Pseudomonas weihenstephanensis]|uniref:hypothetical protein n=1 Tax=Pseudomonas weihenstephanensis TaxID=1608994 RepID=UPI00193BDB78|nr:hypothetical protein [Pseudomonas weihenstephanensis]
MGDHSELRRLAEACGDLNWRTIQESWCEWAIRDDHAYIATMRTKSAKNPGPCVEREAKAKFICAMTPAAVLALIAEVDNLEHQSAALIKTARQANQLSSDILDERNQARIEVNRLAIREDVLENLCDARFRINLDLETERDQLKAEIAGLKTGYEAYEQVNAGLKAEVEVLRDDLEQIQYDANAWRNQEESVWIEVFNSDGDDPFISAISGQITVEQLALIQAEILEYRDDYFEKGSGLYVFRCAHYQAHYDNVGMTEPAHWETDFESYTPFQWLEEAAALADGDQS